MNRNESLKRCHAYLRATCPKTHTLIMHLIREEKLQIKWNRGLPNIVAEDPAVRTKLLRLVQNGQTGDIFDIAGLPR
jgi:hypothetical protein